jgi:cyclophilin family peptidyl-prolyl cis-trans isomerase
MDARIDARQKLLPLVNENQVDEPMGTLAMAAATVPSGGQFYVVVGKGPAPKYNVFGTCTTDAAVAIANLPRDDADKPTTDVHMQRIDIARCP